LLPRNCSQIMSARQHRRELRDLQPGSKKALLANARVNLRWLFCLNRRRS